VKRLVGGRARRRMGQLALLGSIGLLTGVVAASERAVPAKPGEKTRASGPRKGSRFDPSSKRFLDMFHVSQMQPAGAKSGQVLELIKFVPVAEDPDFDPLAEIDKITVQWKQTGGPPAMMEAATTARPRAIMPAVTELQLLTFQVTISNPSGARTGTLPIHLRPR
jgi:hypothetical protein